MFFPILQVNKTLFIAEVPKGVSPHDEIMSADPQAVWHTMMILTLPGGARPSATCIHRRFMLDGSYHVQSAPHRPFRAPGGGVPPRLPAVGRLYDEGERSRAHRAVRLLRPAQHVGGGIRHGAPLDSRNCIGLVGPLRSAPAV